MMEHDEPQTAEERDLIGEAPQSPSANVPYPIPNLQSPILLAIDTCTNRSSVALRDAQVLRAESSWESNRHHTAAVSAQIHRLMDACDIKAVQIGAVAVAIGPGSFTGVRCGLAIAKGIAIARDLPLIGISAFDVTASAQPNLNLPVLALVEIGRSRVAGQRYEWQDGRPTAAGEWRILAWRDLAASIDAPVWACGDLPAGLIAMLGQNAIVAPAPLNLRRAGYLAEIGYARWTSGKVDDVLTLTPIYPPENQPQ
jgi:tRNA threonylcarbamoyladenosine biosynthesis protein TsaB